MIDIEEGGEFGSVFPQVLIHLAMPGPEVDRWEDVEGGQVVLHGPLPGEDEGVLRPLEAVVSHQ